jgi:hypothetical protein
MTDYYPVIARGVAGLKDNTAEARRALYERVQTALTEQLRELDPPLEEPDILRERLALEAAVRKMETHAEWPASSGARARRISSERRVARLDAPYIATGIDAPHLVPGEGNGPRASRRDAPALPRATSLPRRGFMHLVALVTAWLTVLGTVALAFTLYWQRDELKVWLGASPAAGWQRAILPALPKIGDRVSPVQQPASIQRASLYEEDAAQQQGRRYGGGVKWRIEKSTEAKSSDIAILAELEIPERNMRMTMSLRRNPDKMLPASHTVEIAFRPGGDFEGVSNIPGLLMKSAELSDGARLDGVTAKVTPEMFLIGLSGADGQVQRNLQMLKEQAWFDIPILYGNGRRAILALEKGASGERAFQEAFAAWGE